MGEEIIDIEASIQTSISNLIELGLNEKAAAFFAEQCKLKRAEDPPFERVDGEPTSQLDLVHMVENQMAKDYSDIRVEMIEKKREESAKSKFSQLTMTDRIADCCYKRAIRVLFADPGKPNRIIFDRFERKDDGLEVFVELDKFMKGASGFDISNPDSQEFRAWPIIQACLEQLGFRPAWGRNPQKPWEGGGRSAAEGTKTTAGKKASGGMKT